MILEGPGEGGGITEKEESGAAAEQPVQNVELRPSTKAHGPQEVPWSSSGGLATEATHTVLAGASGQSWLCVLGGCQDRA